MKRYFLLIIFCLLITGCSSTLDAPVIVLNGESELTIEVHSNYIDEGAYAIYDEVHYNISSTDEVNTDVLGTYQLSYDYSIDGLIAPTVKRTIHVVDTTKPEVSFNNSSEIVLEVNQDSIEDFITISDNYNSSEEIVIYYVQSANSDVLGTYSVEFYAIDTSGNQSDTLTSNVSVVDTISPQIELVNQNITMGTEDDFPLEAILYSDNYDSIEEIEIRINGLEDLNLGENIILVSAVDSSGNESESLAVIINIIDDIAPVIAFSELDDFTHEQGVPFTNDYLLLYDNLDDYEDIELVVEGEVDIFTLGEYEMSYYAIDKSGNQSETITKTVTVIEPEELNYFERYMKDHTSLYDPIKFTNNYMYDPIEKAYRGLILNNEGDYKLVYFFFLHNMLDGGRVLSKIEFINREGDNIIYVLDDETIDYVFEIPLEFTGEGWYFNIKTYPHEEYQTSEDYWMATFSFNSVDNLDVDYVLSQDLKQGNLK